MRPALASSAPVLDTRAICCSLNRFVMLPSNRPPPAAKRRPTDWIGRLKATVPLCLLLAVPAAVLAQEVFVTRGSGGSPAFSDQPQPGAKPVTLPPLNVIEPVPVAKGVPAASRQHLEATHPTAVVRAYRRFRIVFPEDDGSVAANTAIFEVRVALEPPLQLGEGHAIRVSVNGRPVGQRFTASEFTIPPEFWGDTLPPANQRYQLDAAIVDRDGEVLKRASPVTFYLRYVTVHRYPRQRPMPLPIHVDEPVPPPPPPKEPWVKKLEQQGARFYER
ncbi:conserved hypothetical protein [Candidatus Accumulibacter aalborgensis]|uniref:DUF4124 domain-containing protein n=1 Tax=Candidatus Accumulibacter aalborgensis TaxID=1860102 RepID=A0A1A8XFY2_9PROT|nr:hypothetical protein [Candidatus Accumulibacter aalborgensis]SBT04080.1 conserved hypothetical protein [Candidatus Accumulibacter aalborgensis]